MKCHNNIILSRQSIWSNQLDDKMMVTCYLGMSIVVGYYLSSQV